MASVREISFLLLKPDAIVSAEIACAISNRLNELRLTVIARSDVQLSRHDLRELWPEMPPKQCPFAYELLNLYLAEQPLELIVVRGADAVADCCGLKRDIRGQYALGTYANCLHTPATGAELQQQLPVLWPSAMKYLSKHQISTRGEMLQGIWGSLATVAPIETATVAKQIWDTAQQQGWPQVWEGPIGSGPAALSLRSQARYSIDYIAAGLFEALPDCSTTYAVTSALELNRVGSLVLMRGSYTDVSSLVTKLRGFALHACTDA